MITPDAFRNDWYGELTNQCGHTLMGILGAGLIAALWRSVDGEMPYRWFILGAVVAFYALVIEWKMQGWASGDSWFDTAMVGLGAAGVVLPFEEVGVTDAGTMVVFDHVAFVAVIATWAAFLTPRVLVRWRRQNG